MPSLTKVQTGFLEPQGAFTLDPGTASAPGLKFSTSAATGMFSPSTGVLGFSTGSTQNALTILTGGNLGIGTTIPAAKLHVQGDAILNTIGFNGTSANAFGSYWAGASGYPAYQFAGGNSRFGFSSTAGVVDVYADGNFYATDSSYLVLHAANYTSYAMPIGSSATNSVDLRAPIFYDSNNTAYYTDPASTSNLSRLTVAGRQFAYSADLDLSALNVNTYYPVTIPINFGRATTLRIENALNANVPSWSTHGGGFSVYIEWVSNGNGWGSIPITRRIVDWRESLANVTIVGGLGQLSFSSEEIIWLRGGGVYHFFADNNVTPTVRTSSYTSPYGQSANTSASVVNSPWEQATGAGYAFPNIYSTGVIKLNTDSSYMIGCPSYGYRFNNNAGTITALAVNNSGQCTAYADFRAPIFYDSNNTAYYTDPASTSNLNNVQVTTFGVGTAASGTTGEIRATGNITSNYSDERLKENINPISSALSKVLTLKGVTFNSNKLAEQYGYTDKKEQVGVIAQDVEKVLPQVVVPAPFDIAQDEDGNEYSKSGENYKTVHYDKLVPLLIEAIKELKGEIEELKLKILV